MTADQRRLHEQHWRERLRKQSPHEWLLPVRVRWDLPWDARGVVIEQGRRDWLNEAKLDAVLSPEAAEDPWLDDTYVIDRSFVALPGCAHLPTGEPLTPWVTTSADGAELNTVETLIGMRQRMIDGMARDPFNHGWISEHWRGPLIRLCQRRLANPGVMLTLMVLGGNRLGKSWTIMHLLMCNFSYPVRPPGARDNPGWDAKIICAHETEAESQRLHHPYAYHFLPAQLKPGDGKKLKGAERQITDTFTYQGGKFVNNAFGVVRVAEDGTRHGGEWSFRNYRQDLDTFQGGEANCIFLDELCPQEHFDTTPARIASRTEPTRQPEYLAMIRELLALLEAGEPMHLLPRRLLGALAHGVRFWTVTPINGCTASVKTALSAVKYAGWRVAPILKQLFKPAADPDFPPQSKWQLEGGQRIAPDWLVPTHGSTPDPTFQIELLPTSMNIWKPAYHSQMSSYKHAGRQALTMRLYGYVRGTFASDFSAYDESRHVGDWSTLANDGTLYEFLDPAPHKPWFMQWAIVDKLGRLHVLQEWPCWWKEGDEDKGIPVNGGNPGPWAVPSRGDRWNGDEGDAQKLRLNWSPDEYCRHIWLMRMRIVEQFKKQGREYLGKTLKAKLEWKDKPHWTLEGEFAIPEWTVMDPVWCAEDDEGNRARSFEEITLQDEFQYELEHGFEIKKGARGSDISVRSERINKWLTGTVMGQPMFQINRECGNTRWALSTFSTPAFRNKTKSNDEACKDPIDALGYGCMRELRFVDRTADYIEDDGRR